MERVSLCVSFGIPNRCVPGDQTLMFDAKIDSLRSLGGCEATSQGQCRTLERRIQKPVHSGSLPGPEMPGRVGAIDEGPERGQTATEKGNSGLQTFAAYTMAATEACQLERSEGCMGRSIAKNQSKRV